MLFGRVRGTVVSASKAQTLEGAKLLIVQPIDMNTMQDKAEYVICVDDVGAGDGDVVICAYGSSARQTDSSKQFASDYSIYGIVDNVSMRGKKTYDKAEDTFGTAKKEK